MSPSTLEDIRIDVAREQRNRFKRSFALAFVAASVLVGALGGFGVSTREAATSNDGLELEVRHPRVARGGLAVPLEVRAWRAGGISHTVRLSMAAEYLEAFDVNAVLPEPAETSSSGEVARWTFEPPVDGILAVRFDVRVEPGVQWARHGFVEVEVAGVVARVDLDTWIAP